MELKYIREVRLKNKIHKNSYLRNIAAVKYLEKNPLVFDNEVTFFVGENGAGKSTVIEAIASAMRLNTEGGTKNYTGHRFSVANDAPDLEQHIIVAKEDYPKEMFFLRAESMYNLINFLENYGSTRYTEKYHQQSHGETLIDIISSFKGDGLYIFDEPESALSPSKMLTLMLYIHNLVKRNSQLIIATHSPILMAYPGADIFLFSENGIDKVKYTDTEHYQITKLFLDHPERMIKELFRE